MRREKNYKTARLIEALEYIDVRFIEEAAEKIKTRPTGQAFYGKPSRSKALRQFLALAACVLLLSAAIPAITYLANHLPDIVAFFIGDETTETDPELTHPETPAPETSRSPETSINTDHETTAPLYDGTTAEPEPEHNGSYGLEYKMNEDGKSAMLFHRGICTDENVIVASVWNGVPVTIIGEAAFADYIKYKTITIPESVTAIDMRAFKNCTGLESVVLHDGISYIGADAFENCIALKEITLPKSLEWIQTGLFMNCINLQKVIIGNEVERIVFGAFYDCSALRELHYLGTKAEWNNIQKDLTWNTKSAITVVHCSDGDVDITPYNADEPEYDGSRGLEYKVNNDGKTASLFGIGTCTDTEIVVASTYNGLPVTSVDYSFSKISNVTSITVSDSVLTIGGIDNMPDLVSVYFSKSVTGINPESLIGCPNLVIIEVDKDNPKYMSSGNCLIEKATKTIVHGCKGSIIPTDGSVTVIGEFSFHGCDWLTELTIPEGIERIDAYAFAGCESLKKVNLPDSLEALGYAVFHNSSALENVKIGKNLEIIGSSVFDGCSKLNNLSFPKTLKLIGELTFFECISLNNVSFEGTCAEWNAIEKVVLWIDGAAFNVVHCSDGDVDLIEYDGSRGLEYRIEGNHAVLAGIGTCTDKDIAVATKYNGFAVTEIGSYALYNCQFIESIAIPEGVTVIADEAFYLCKNLKNVTLPSTLEYIQDWAFANCESLESIVIPDSVKWIGQRAFSDCAKLSSVTLGQGLEQIQGSAFHNCAALKSVKFPRGLKLIEADAFSGCTSLADIAYAGTVSEWNFVDSTGEGYYYQSFTWHKDVPAPKILCSDGEAMLDSPSAGRYRAVLNNEAKFILDSKEIFLDEFCFPYSGLSITACDDVKYAIVDMDRDGENEVVITGANGDMLVLHDENGKFYGFDFSFRNMDRIKTDGSFEWNDTTSEGLSYGDAMLSFDSDKCQKKNICQVTGDGTDNVQFFVDGNPTTREDYLNAYASISKTEVTWYPIEKYPIN